MSDEKSVATFSANASDGLNMWRNICINSFNIGGAQHMSVANARFVINSFRAQVGTISGKNLSITEASAFIHDRAPPNICPTIQIDQALSGKGDKL